MSIKLHELKPAVGATKSKKRIARGQGSTRGGTATRGHKGAQSRSGSKRKYGFEGGQQPLQRRIPKFGFRNPNRKSYKTINLDRLDILSGDHKVLTLDDFINKGLVSKKDRLKILGKGTLSKPIEIHAHAFSKTAQASIEKAGGRSHLLTK